MRSCYDVRRAIVFTLAVVANRANAQPAPGDLRLPVPAGVRDLTPDYHGILGPAAQAPGFHVACGFSGHGFMHSLAIGILMTEMLLDGRATSMDISALSLDRFATGRLRAEANMF